MVLIRYFRALKEPHIVYNNFSMIDNDDDGEEEKKTR